MQLLAWEYTMLALEVLLNGKRIAIAGADDLNVLTGIVTAVGKLGPKASGTKGLRKNKFAYFGLIIPTQLSR